MNLIQELQDQVISGKSAAAVEKVQQALNDGMAPNVILQDGLIKAMDVVGHLFETGEIFVPEMLVAARAMDKALAVLKPHLAAQGVEPIGKVAIGTVKGDLHDIGKKLVTIMLEGAGFEVKDLGVDVVPEKYVQAIHDGAQIICMSALLTTTMPSMKHAVDAIQQAGVRDKTKIMIGGAPVTQAYADQIGADGYARDAASAARLARELLAV